MNFASVQVGSIVFIDANTLVYHFSREPQFGLACTDLLLRVAADEVQAITTASAVNDAVYRLLTIEASKALGVPFAGIGRRLQGKPDEVKRLSQFRQVVDDLPKMKIDVHSVSYSTVRRAAELSQLHGLLSNDALILAAMESAGVTMLASNDGDFDRVPGITRYAPL